MNNLEYEQRVMALKLPRLEYSRARRVMTETFKIIHSYYDHETVPCLSCMNLLELEDTLSNYIKRQFLLISMHVSFY